MKFYKKYSKMIGSLHIWVPPCQIPFCRMPWPQPRKVIHWFGPITLEAKAAANAQYGSEQPIHNSRTKQSHLVSKCGWSKHVTASCRRPPQHIHGKKTETDMQPHNYTKTNMNDVIEKLFSGWHWHYTWSQPNLLCLYVFLVWDFPPLLDFFWSGDMRTCFGLYNPSDSYGNWYAHQAQVVCLQFCGADYCTSDVPDVTKSCRSRWWAVDVVFAHQQIPTPIFMLLQHLEDDPSLWMANNRGL